ncbi:MAG: hypothetical protein L0387_40605 [Acidobacteria bacterium]|nr:hypothetical protein [Acidobacteriota bacterium]
MDIRLDFSCTYEVEVLPELPGSSGLIEEYYFSPESRGGGEYGLLLKVTPAGKPPWLGCFMRGDLPSGSSGVYGSPDPNGLCVVLAGQGYAVPVADPRMWKEIPCSPIRHACSVPEKYLLVFADFTRLVAYDRAGLKWISPDVCWDDLEIVEVNDCCVKGTGWNAPTGARAPFAVDLRSGQPTLSAKLL